MSEHAILRDGEVVPAPLMEWAQEFEHSNRVIGQDRIGLYFVSTVFLGINHAFGDDPPLWFETMVFGEPTRDELDVERYTTLAQAKIGHDVMVAKVRAIVGQAS